MAIDDILQKILAEAAAVVSDIEKETKVKILDLEKESKKLEEEDRENLKQKKAKAIKTLSDKATAIARQNEKKQLLLAKHEIVKQAKENFCEYLCNLPDSKYSLFISKLMKATHIDSGKVFVPKNRLELSQSIITEKFDIVASEKIKGGFVLRTATAEIDNSFQNLIFSEFRNDLEEFFAKKFKLI